MAAVDEIAIKLGVKKGDLKAALADVGADIKKFKKDGERSDEGFGNAFRRIQKGFGDLKTILLGGGIVAAFRQVFDAAVSYAEKYTGAYDESVAATLRLRDAQQDLGSVVGKVGTTVIGWMEKVGLAAGAIYFGVDEAAEALNRLEGESKKAFDDTQAKKLAQAQEKLNRLRTEQATGDEKINRLAAEYTKLLEEQRQLTEGTLGWTEKTIQVETKRGELAKAENDVRKKEADERREDAQQEEQMYREYAEAAEARQKNAVKGKKEIAQATADQAKAEEDVVGTLEEEVQKLQEQGVGYDQIKASLVGRGFSEEEIVKFLDEQAAAIEKQNQKLREQEMVRIRISRSGKDYDDQTDAALEGVRQRVKRQLDEVSQRNAILLPNERDPTEIALRSELDQIERELDRRRIVRDTAKRLGEDAARGRFGDTSTDSALRSLQDTATKQQKDIEALRKLFEDAFRK